MYMEMSHASHVTKLLLIVYYMYILIVRVHVLINFIFKMITIIFLVLLVHAHTIRHEVSIY